MELRFPKEITIMSVKFKVVQNKTHNGGSFDLATGVLEIGTECIKEDSGYTFMVICHELSEIIHVLLGTRYKDPSVEGNWKFFLDHKEFENHQRVFALEIQKFIK